MPRPRSLVVPLPHAQTLPLTPPHDRRILAGRSPAQIAPHQWRGRVVAACRAPRVVRGEGVAR
jgi:hypothetical protein